MVVGISLTPVTTILCAASEKKRVNILLSMKVIKFIFSYEICNFFSFENHHNVQILQNLCLVSC